MEIKRLCKLFIVQMVIFQAVYWSLTLLDFSFPFKDSFSWPISLGWWSMVALPLILTIKRLKSDWKACTALWLCGVFYGLDFLLHFNIKDMFDMSTWTYSGYKIGAAAWLWFGLGLSALLLEQVRMFIISAVMFALGGAVAIWSGGVITTAEYYWVYVVENVLFLSLTLSSVVGKPYDPQVGIEEQQAEEYRKAA